MPSGSCRRVMRAATALLLVACTHSEPFGTDLPDPLGPADPDLPRQLTYNIGDDRAPTVAGPALTFSRRDPSYPERGECIALLPAAGGTLSARLCPPGPTPADTLVSSWLEPALSPDRSRLAFVWRFAPWSHHLTLAPVDSPTAALRSLRLGGTLSGDRTFSMATELQWITPDRIRLLFAQFLVTKVDDGGPGRQLDTAVIPRALMELNVATGAFDTVPGGDSAAAWAAGADGTFVVLSADPALVVRLEADGSRTPVGSFPGSVSDLAAVGSRLVAAVGTDLLYWLDPSTGARGTVGLPGIAWRLAAADSGRVVVEVERPGDKYGGPANLWLVGLPD